MPKITPSLWFDDDAEEAAGFYAAVFGNSKVGRCTRGPNGRALVVEFEIEGQPFIALNGGSRYRFTEAVSFLIHCQTQEEVDYDWSELSAGPETEQCGWLKDRFGLSWQVVPTILAELTSKGDAAKSQRMMRAMLGMKKLDIAALRAAYDGD